MSFFITAPTMSSSCAMPASCIGPAVLGRAHLLVLLREVRDDVHARRVEPDEERLAVLLGLVDELERACRGSRRRPSPCAPDRACPASSIFCLPILPQRGSHGRVVLVGRPAVDHVARADLVLERPAGSSDAPGPPSRRGGRGSRRTRRSRARVGRNSLQVAEVVLAELPGRVAHRLERRGDGRRLRRHADRRAGLADGRQAGADRQLAGDEVGAARRAARLGVVVGEAHALGGEPVEVRRPAGHDALVIGADVEPADVVAHDEDDVRLALGLRDRRCSHREDREADAGEGACEAASSPHGVFPAFRLVSIPGRPSVARVSEAPVPGSSNPLG